METGNATRCNKIRDKLSCTVSGNRRNHTLQYSTNNGSTWSDASFGRNGSITGEAKYNGTNASVSTFSTYQTRVGYTGTGNSGNLQPYFTCYIWEKTAL